MYWVQKTMSIIFIRSLCMVVLGAQFVHSRLDNYCPEVNSQELQWTRQPATLAFQCVGFFKKLYCCAAGYNTLIWYQQDEDGIYKPIEYDEYQYAIDSNQTLVLTTTDWDDGGNYKCQITSKNGKSMYFIEELRLKECNNWHQKPLMLPKPLSEEIKRMPGQSLASTCTAFYGNCNNDNDLCGVLWESPSGQMIQAWDENNTNSNTFTEPFREDTNGQVYITTQILHIKNIQEQDYGTYKCYGYNSYGDSPKLIHLKKGHPEGSYVPLYAKVIGPAVIAVFIGIVACGCLLYRKYRIDIKYFYKEKFGVARPKEFEFDCMLIFDYECRDDQEFVNYDLHHSLDARGYEIFNADIDVQGNQCELDEIWMAHGKSYCVIMYITQSFLTSPKMTRVFQEMDSDKRRNLIFIIKHDVNDESLDNLMAQIPDTEDRNVVNRVKKAMQHGRKYKWPEDENENTLNQFWKRVCLELPNKTQHNDNDQRENEHPEAHQAAAARAQNRTASSESRVPLILPTTGEDEVFDVVNERCNNTAVFQHSGESGYSSNHSFH